MRGTGFPVQTITLPDESATLALGALWASILQPHNPPWIVFLEGDLGAGKTSLVRGFVRGTGYTGTVKSPTYTLIESYPWEADRLSTENIIYHFDLYRLVEPQALDFIGIHDYCKEPGIVWIEWPEKGKGLLPDPDFRVALAVVPEGRQLSLQQVSQRAQALDFIR